VYELSLPDDTLLEELAGVIWDRVGNGVNIFFINGDEVDNVLGYLDDRGRSSVGGYNIIYPVWELANYPSGWARHLNRFDEVWVPTRFVYGAVSPRVNTPVRVMPFASQVDETTPVTRDYFGLSDDQYIFLNFFDFSSYSARKNPVAVLDAFRAFLRMRPDAETKLVVKVSGGAEHASELEALSDHASPIADRVLFLDRVFNTAEMASLTACCDCFVSLHRAEGFGRGLSEAMSLGKPVIATAYSGNVDFMDRRNSLLVDYELTPVDPKAYPFAEGQAWAEADVLQAAEYMSRLYDDRELGSTIGAMARQSILRSNGYRSVGLRYRQRIEEIRRARS
jgi:glycosyltransferase involved in cell wall biosynthesis